MGFVSTVCRSSKGLHFFPGVSNDGLLCQFWFQAVKQCVLAEFPELWSCRRCPSPELTLALQHQESSPSSSGQAWLSLEKPKVHKKPQSTKSKCHKIPLQAGRCQFWLLFSVDGSLICPLIFFTSEIINATNFFTPTQNFAKKSHNCH